MKIQLVSVIGGSENEKDILFIQPSQDWVEVTEEDLLLLRKNHKELPENYVIIVQHSDKINNLLSRLKPKEKEESQPVIIVEDKGKPDHRREQKREADRRYKAKQRELKIKKNKVETEGTPQKQDPKEEPKNKLYWDLPFGYYNVTSIKNSTDGQIMMLTLTHKSGKGIEKMLRLDLEKKIFLDKDIAFTGYDKDTHKHLIVALADKIKKITGHY